jgi:hypothetical protein
LDDERYHLRMRAIALLRESMRPHHGVMTPRFSEVAKLPDMPTKRTLRRWWQTYDGDKTSPQALARARADQAVRATAEGIQEWHTYQIDQIRDAIAWILSPEHRARALRDVAPVIESILSTGNKEQEENRQSHTSRINRLKKAARRVGIVDPKAGG